MTAYLVGVAVGMLIVWETEMDYPKWLWRIRCFFEEVSKAMMEKIWKK